MKARPRVLKKKTGPILRVLLFLQSFGTAIWWTNAFTEELASENLPVKVPLTRGYTFFHESYIHDVEGKLPAVICIEHLAR